MNRLQGLDLGPDLHPAPGLHPAPEVHPEGPERTSVSVVIPVLDDAAALERCLALLAAQSRRADEVVVVDNGSTDASARIAHDAGAHLVREPRRGIPAASAAGYDAAVGELLVRCDADTRAPADWLARIVEAFAADPQLAALTGPGRFYDLPGAAGRALSAWYTTAYRWAAGAAMAGTPLWGSNLAMRTSVWDQVRLSVHRERADVHDDLDLSFQLRPEHRVRYRRDLWVGVEGRMFHSRADAARRMRWAWRTLRLNWAVLPAGHRWLRRFGWRPSGRGPTEWARSEWAPPQSVEESSVPSVSTGPREPAG